MAGSDTGIGEIQAGEGAADLLLAAGLDLDAGCLVSGDEVGHGAGVEVGGDVATTRYGSSVSVRKRGTAMRLSTTGRLRTRVSASAGEARIAAGPRMSASR